MGLSAFFAGAGTLRQRCADEWCARGHQVADDAASDIHFLFLIGCADDGACARPASPRCRVIAYQDALLPAYAGWHATSWALLRGEATHGITWYVPEAGGSAVPLQRVEFPIAPTDTAFSLNAKCFDAAVDGFRQLVRTLEQPEQPPLPARRAEPSYYGPHQRPPAAGLLDFNRPAAELAALARALNFADHANPLALPKLWRDGTFLAVQQVTVAAESPAAEPGTVLAVESGALTVATADGAVRIHSAQAAAGIQPGAQLPVPTAGEIRALTAAHEALAPHEEFWIQRWSAVQPIALPGARAAAAVASAEQLRVTVPDGATAEALLAAHAAFVLRMTGAEGLDLAWRDSTRSAPVEGFEPLFAETLPLRIDAAGAESFTQIQATVARELADLRAHGTHLLDLFDRTPALRDGAGRTPSVGLSFGPAPDALQAEQPLWVEIAPDGRSCTWYYDAGQLDARSLAERFTRFLRHALAQPDQAIGDIPLLSESEVKTQLVDWNQTTRPYPDAPIHALFEQHVRIHPDRLAVSLGNAAIVPEGQASACPQGTQRVPLQTSLTYAQLNARANQLARRLVALGVGPDQPVGLCTERSLDMVIGLLAILKAGGAYLPLDPAHPAERIQLQLDDAGVRVVLVPSSLPSFSSLVQSFGPSVLPLDTDCSAESTDNLDRTLSNRSLAYILYTSGSTGTPKGVLIEHRSVVRLVRDNPFIAWRSDDRVLQHSPLAFDASTLEVWGPLLNGALLVLLPPGPFSFDLLTQTILRENISLLWLTASVFHRVADDAPASLASVRHLLAGGEVVSGSRIAKLLNTRPDLVISNGYGPTESTTFATTASFSARDSVDDPPPLGRPIANTQVYILDDRLHLLPPGVPGELCIGGDGLARGYLNRPDLSAQAFVPNPFPGTPGDRLYRTGDRARFRPDGVIEFLGRRDSQVKIRGYRIEPGEVEATLASYPNLQACAVVVRTEPSQPGPVETLHATSLQAEKQLVAYLSMHAGHPAPSVEALRAHLKKTLPEFMLPALFSVLPALPLNASGKVDRRALPNVVTRPVLEADYRPPQGDVERILTNLWQQVLGLDRVGTADNFFDLGGTSLKLARVQTSLRASLQRDIPILDLFRFPTIAALAAHLSTSEAAAAPRRRAARAAAGDDAIAVIGMAGRFPGAESVEQLWQNICAGKESISFFDDAELDTPPPPADGGVTFVKARSVLDRCEWFDAAFFGYGPRDAELMDPQHRVFLECAWEALEHAACDPARYPGHIGVFASCSLNTYLMYHVLATRAAVNELAQSFQVGGYQTLVGNDKDYVASRVAYKLNLRGPGITVQSACSSSLVGICQAAQNLASGLCDIALAGGVSITFPQKRGYPFVEGSIGSADGHCRPFDASASGTVFGSGVGIVVLKRLADAQADGDTIYAVLKGWALNNDGGVRAGYMAPSAEGQADVIRMALERAQVDARTIGFVETHGTGTPLGDPIEVAGLTRAFRLSTPDTGFCALGSIKANIGHIESASGATGLIKAVLALHHRQIPPLLHFERPNPLMDLPSTPFYATNQLLPWPAGTSPRRAGVSSFGVGGTNAHVVLEEAPAGEASAEKKSTYLLPLSARTDTALAAVAANLATFLEQRGDRPLSEVAYTLQSGRQALERRGFVVAGTPAEAVAALRAAGGVRALKLPATAPSVVFLFPGQGSQHVDMGRGLYESEPVFRQHLDACVAILRPLLGLDLLTLLYPEPARRAECEQQLTQTQFAQPALFCIEYALARWWMAHGVTPTATIGHSAGEYVGAVLAGVFSLEDALKVLVERARLMQAQPPGQMLAVRLTESELQPWLTPDLALAAANAPGLHVVSGPTAAITDLQQRLEAAGIGGRLLQTSHAFHSAMMEPALAPFRRVLESVTLRPASGPFLSTRAGGWITPDEVATPEYWVRQLRESVRFSRAVQALQAQPGTVFLEVGPSQALTTLALQHDDPTAPVTAIPSLRHSKENLPDYAGVLRAAGRLWQVGHAFDWTTFCAGQPPRRIALPTYPFERKRYWIEAPKAEAGATPTALELKAAPDDGTHEPHTSQEAAPADPQEVALNEVLDILQDLSGIDRATIVPQQAFLELGFDSLFLTQLSMAFQKKFLVKLTLRQMLDELSSPGAIAGYVAAHRPSAAAPAKPAAEAPAGDKLAPAQAGPFGPETAAPPAPPVGQVRHGPFAPINKSAGDALTPKQQQALDALIARYTARTRRSKEHTQKHRAHFSDPRAVSGFRITWKEITYPVVSARSAGAKIWDLDENEYIDVTMGFGTYLFGHNPEFIRTAIEAQLKEGFEIGPQNRLAGDVARMVCDLSGMDRATFCTTGSEAVMGAVRAARTVTGRSKVVYFSGDYHGVHEEVLAKGQPFQGRTRTVPIAPGIPNELVSQVIVLTYGDPAALEAIRAQAGDLAAVLVEPVQSRKPELQPREFLHQLRALTQEHGIALIFDEIVTGFRIHQGGSQAYYGIKADLATYGKIIGGGMPIGVIAGRKEYLDAFDGGHWQYGDGSIPEAGVTFFAGTFVRHPLAMAAAQAVLKHLVARGPALQDELGARTAKFVDHLNAHFDAEGIDLHINRCGSVWYFSHGESFKYYSLMFHFLRELGIHIWEGRPCFLSTAHTDEDVARLTEAFKQAMKNMRDGGFLPERVVRVPDQGPFALTDAQQEIWLTSRFDPSAAASFNESCALTFRGPLDRAAMESALRQLVARHESLRTTFEPTGERQLIADTAVPELGFSDLAGLDPATRERELDALVREEVRRPFDLAQAPLLRARLIRLEPTVHVMLLTAHHVICDGWSYDVMTRDLSALYSMNVQGERDQRPRPTQFRDYARFLTTYRREPRYDADLNYWLRTLSHPPAAVSLPTDRPRPAQRSFAGAMEVAPADEALLTAIKELGARQRATLFSTLMALYAVLLHRLTGQQDLVIGIPAAGQQMMEGQDLVGHCANLLPLRLHVAPERPFSELLRDAQQAMLDAYEHQGITFGALLRGLQVPRDPARPPLIQVTFNVDPAMRGLNFKDLESEIVINPRAGYQFEHSLNIVAYSNRLRMECNYNSDLFTPETIRRWLDHYRTIARAVSAQPDQAIGDIPLLSESEVKTQLVDWNQTTRPYPDAPIHTLFEQQVRIHPDRLAVSLGNAAIVPEGQASACPQGTQRVPLQTSLTYAQLNARANQLARRLVALGVGPDQPVGLCTERSLDMVIGLLAILKAGGAYLPLDPAHPAERIQLQLDDAGVRVVLVPSSLPSFSSLVQSFGPSVLPLDTDCSAESTDNLDRTLSNRSLAYILYTSGSTGTPKGVLIEHRSVVRLVRDNPFIAWRSDDRVLQHSPLAFDASTLEVWGPLLNGALLVLLPPGPFSFDLLTQTILRENISLLWLTASVFHRVADDAPASLASVRHLLAGGEVVSGSRIAKLLNTRPDLVISNGYGPTESTTFATTASFSARDSVDDPPPLGRPIANTQVYILDDRLHLLPPGVPGELCIGGDGLARGYLNRPDLSAQAFVPNPFPGTPGDRLYRTGDRARFRPDGVIEFLGRRDSQVKIRGYRIEPGEVEATLASYPNLQACAVVVRTEPSQPGPVETLHATSLQAEKQLVAYLSMHAGHPAPSVEALRAHLKKTLPEFMLPALFSVLPALPLNASGKVDRRALPDPETGRAVVSDAFVAPQTEDEIRVAAIWAEVLGLPRVGLQDDFFAAGGHSLTALKLITRMAEAGYEVEVTELFRQPTIEQLLAGRKPVAPAAVASPVRSSEFAVQLKQGHAGRTPLVLLPSDFGDLLIYTGLMPLLKDDLPCIGLQCPRMYENDQGIASMGDLAGFFIKQLQTLQPRGPYQLAGYCFGGFVALEMANQLRAAGQEVAMLGLIDTRPYHPVVQRGEYLRMLVQGALRATPADWKRHLAARASARKEERLVDQMARNNPDKLDRRDLNRWVLEQRTLRTYRSTPYNGRITYFYPEESHYELYGDPTCGWLHLAERVDIHKVLGSHLNMMKEPHVRRLAAVLQSCLRGQTGDG